VSERMAIVVSGSLVGAPRQGGAMWAVLQYALGLRQLGHDVLLVEQLAFDDDRFGASARAFEEIAQRFGLERDSALLDAGTSATVGLSRSAVERRADGADLLLNISGSLSDERLLTAVAHRAYLDLDPGFTQLWHAVDGVDMGFDRHDSFVTIGLRIGDDGCDVPTCGRTWIATPQPVVLEHWPFAAGSPPELMTTVGNWRSYGSIEHDGALYGQRAHSLRELLDLAGRLPVRVALALAIDGGEHDDLAALRRHGWTLTDPDVAAGTPARYEAYVGGSWAELCVAKSGYVASSCGWFSDRSACYLASGRPVVAQDTGFARLLPSGEGLHSFASGDEAVSAVEDVRSDYERHRRAAREIAEEHFASDRVLTRMLEAL
jgi:hypothetical protein